ncbi:unnamed protein product [Dovyalis caffra]|uniref:Uncharacterized protein n=1 Tax=Dovyalis caffra TaxID=77055 RepID=A0AAV1S855_9ROSI|nr:unnamed protein product [Dovyalis caffra]
MLEERGNLEVGIGGGKLEEECMKGLLLNVCSVKDSKRRIRWDSGLVIRSRGRWGKCG